MERTVKAYAAAAVMTSDETDRPSTLILNAAAGIARLQDVRSVFDLAQRNG